VTAEQIFCRVKPDTPIEIDKPDQTYKIDPIYNEDDSDNDSDFEPIYKQTKDDFSDL
jgi:hypothetical protein